MEEYCKTCKFWRREGTDGICKKNSPHPTVMEQGKTYVIVWPKIGPNEPACNDHDPFVIEGAS
jgi:hypothetical protein